jgi:nicotinate-nucleotide adenylyltransferase
MKIAIFGGAFNPLHYGHLLLAQTALQQCALECVIWVPAYSPPHKPEHLLAFQHRLEMVRRAIANHPAFAVSDIEATQTGVSYAIATFTALQTRHPTADWFWIVGMDAFQTLPRWYRSAELIPQCTWLVAPRGQEAEGRGDGKTGRGRADGERRAEDGERRAEEKAEGKAEGRGQRAEGKDDGEIMRWRDSAQTHPSHPTTIPPPHHPTILCQEVAAHMATHSIQLRWELLQMPLVDISSRLIRQYCREGRSLRHLLPEEIQRYITDHKLYQMS